MAIPYPPHVLYTQIAADSSVNLITNFVNALVTAGWTVTDNLPALVRLTFSGEPLNTEHITIAGVQYTFVTGTPANVHEIQLTGTAAGDASALETAINANSEVFTAQLLTSTEVEIDWGTGGPSGNFHTVSNGLSNTSLDSSVFRFGGNKLLCAITPAGLQCGLIIDDDNTGSNQVRFRFFSSDFMAPNPSPAIYMTWASFRVFEIRATDYDVCSFLLGDTSTFGTWLYGGVPHVRDVAAPAVITSIADDGTGQILVTPSFGQPLNTGDFVFIDNTLGLSFNGSWQVTVVTTDINGLATSYILNGSTFAGGYTANSGVSGAEGFQISRCVWAQGSTGSRLRIASFTTTNMVAFNQFSFGASGGSGQLYLIQHTPDPNGGTRKVPNYGDAYDVNEARIAITPSSPSATLTTVGDLWAAFCLETAVDKDVIALPANGAPDGRTWVNVMDNATASYMSLWLAKN